jgi:hypothetical protein
MCVRCEERGICVWVGDLCTATNIFERICYQEWWGDGQK